MYKCIYSRNVSEVSRGEYLSGNKIGENNGVCRFCCGQTKPKKKHHAITESLGKNKLYSPYECDECGEYFSQIESDLSDQLMLTRAILGIRGKDGYIKFKYDGSIVEYDPNDKCAVYRKRVPRSCKCGRHLIFKFWIDDSSGRVRYEHLCDGVDDKGIHCHDVVKGIACNRCHNPSIRFIMNHIKKPGESHELNNFPFNAIATYKVYIKMALSIIPDAYIKNFKDAIQWITETKGKLGKEKRQHTNFYGNDRGLWVKPFSYMGKTKNELKVALWERIDKSKNIPDMLFQLFWGQEMYIIEIPMHENANCDKDILAKLPPLCSELEKEYEVKPLINYAEI